MLEQLERLLGSGANPGAPGLNTAWVARVQRFPRRVVVASTCGLGLLATAGSVWWCFAGPAHVDVNFITDRFDATIWLDGEPLRNPDGTLYTTPCIVPGVSAGVHQLVFKYPGLEDLEAGQIDFSKTREIVAHWPTN